MLYHLLIPLADEYLVFNLFRYLTFRTGAAVFTALIVSFLVGPHLIGWLASRGLARAATGPQHREEYPRDADFDGPPVLRLMLPLE